jgi:hypothetical protein
VVKNCSCPYWVGDRRFYLIFFYQGLSNVKTEISALFAVQQQQKIIPKLFPRKRRTHLQFRTAKRLKSLDCENNGSTVYYDRGRRFWKVHRRRWKVDYDRKRWNKRRPHCWINTARRIVEPVRQRHHPSYPILCMAANSTVGGWEEMRENQVGRSSKAQVKKLFGQMGLEFRSNRIERRRTKTSILNWIKTEQ